MTRKTRIIHGYDSVSDEITWGIVVWSKELSPFQPEKVSVEAGKIMLKRIDTPDESEANMYCIITEQISPNNSI